MGFFSLLFGPDIEKMRGEAMRFGITVSEVQRECPHFSKNGRTMTLKQGCCIRYSVPRRSFEPRVNWALLQRTEDLGATLPNDYLLESSEDLPSGLLEILNAIAKEYSEEYFEFEGTSTDVAIYWMEWGGSSKIRELHAALTRLASW